jgi:hypothetical protein
VFIESENYVNSAEEEIWKLCAVSCPLKVLITVAKWDLSEGVWTPLGGSQKNALLSKWRGIAIAHHQVCPNPGVLALLVGECCAQDYFNRRDHQEFQDYRFRFYAHHFDTAIGEWQADGIYQRYLAGPNQNQIGQRLEGWPC